MERELTALAANNSAALARDLIDRELCYGRAVPFPDGKTTSPHSKGQIATVAERVSTAENWNRRVEMIGEIPDSFGKAHHQTVYAAVAKAAYVSALEPDFAYVDLRGEYELAPIEKGLSARSLISPIGFVKRPR